MEYILIALFGGGTLDWEDIGETEYDWKDIFERVKINFNINDIDINTLYMTILEMALEELADAMQNYEGETSEEFKNCAYDINSYFEIYCNCIDTHLSFIDTEKLGKEIQEKMADKIDEINEKIGFTYIEF